jgi:hypothetical protein
MSEDLRAAFQNQRAPRRNCARNARNSAASRFTARRLPATSALDVDAVAHAIARDRIGNFLARISRALIHMRFR